MLFTINYQSIREEFRASNHISAIFTALLLKSVNRSKKSSTSVRQGLPNFNGVQIERHIQRIEIFGYDVSMTRFGLTETAKNFAFKLAKTIQLPISLYQLRFSFVYLSQIPIQFPTCWKFSLAGFCSAAITKLPFQLQLSQNPNKSSKNGPG